MKHRRVWVCLFFLSCFLALPCGCMFQNPYGLVAYQVIYPSGYARDCYTWDERMPIEGTDCQIGWQKAADYETSGNYDLQILDAAGEVVFAYSGLGSRTMRGEAASDGTVWICSEQWDSPHFNGYRSGDLTKSVLLLADMESGEILFSQELKENELYLTSVGTKCYFYHCGTEAEKKLFGLYETKGEHAEVYYRDKSDWSKKVSVYEFDYVEWPEDMEDETSVENRIRFYVQEQAVVIVLTTYEQTDEAANRWEYLEKISVAIPLDRRQR